MSAQSQQDFAWEAVQRGYPQGSVEYNAYVSSRLIEIGAPATKADIRRLEAKLDAILEALTPARPRRDE